MAEPIGYNALSTFPGHAHCAIPMFAFYLHPLKTISMWEDALAQDDMFL